MRAEPSILNALLSVPWFLLSASPGTQKISTPSNPEGNVVFFDDHCVLCNGVVLILLDIDSKRILRYTSLQGEFAKKELNSSKVSSPGSIVFWRNGHLFEKAEAVIQILIALDGKYNAMGKILKQIPLLILNPLYDLIARNRYRLFGKTDVCLVLNSENKNLFIS